MGQQGAGRADLDVVGMRPDGQHRLAARGPGDATSLDQLGGLGDQVLGADRLLQELGGRAAQRRDGVIHRRVPGQHGDRQVGLLLADPFQQFQARHAGQLDVGDQ